MQRRPGAKQIEGVAIGTDAGGEFGVPDPTGVAEPGEQAARLVDGKRLNFMDICARRLRNSQTKNQAPMARSGAEITVRSIKIAVRSARLTGRLERSTRTPNSERNTS